jgi:hypothetical protein
MSSEDKALYEALKKLKSVVEAFASGIKSVIDIYMHHRFPNMPSK